VLGRGARPSLIDWQGIERLVVKSQRAKSVAQIFLDRGTAAFGNMREKYRAGGSQEKRQITPSRIHILAAMNGGPPR
jgi:hypothetical protein